MYDLITEAGIDKWTISMPYMVSEVVRNEHHFPEFKDLAKAVALLLEKHFALGEPIRLSIGGFYKYEMFDIKTIPPKQLNEHPCIPNCNGARGIIIDSFGNILDCLLDNPNEKSLLKNFQEGSFIDLTQRIKNRPFYNMRLKDIKQCCDCPSLGLCGGGCAYSAFLRHGTIWAIDDKFCKHSLTVLEWIIWDIYSRM